jgi:putative transposase
MRIKLLDIKKSKKKSKKLKQNPASTLIVGMRRCRQTRDGATYHITVRANRQELIMHHDAIYELFLTVLNRAKKKYRFQIYNYCIMGNHVHLIIHPHEGESISRIMQWILSVFARAWNKMHSVSGHVWGERFFSKIINTFSEFIHTFNYIAQNPVKAGIAAQADQWEYGGIRHFLMRKKGILDDMPLLLRQIFTIYCRLMCKPA